MLVMSAGLRYNPRSGERSSMNDIQIVNAARQFVGLAIQQPYDWPEPMSKELYAAYKKLEAAVVHQHDKQPDGIASDYADSAE
jgi:hypothetical protein